MEYGSNDLPYGEAARILTGDEGSRGQNSGALQLLGLLGYTQEELSPLARDNRAKLLRFAARMSALLPYRGPDGPGFLFFLGMLDPHRFLDWDGPATKVSTNGADLRPGRAFEASVGEAIEHVSQLEQGTECAVRRRPSAPDTYSRAELASFAVMLGRDSVDSLSGLDWVAGKQLGSGAGVVLPADLCLRRRPSESRVHPAAPLSIGCAAAPSFEGAVLRGLLEVVERDAAALWWRGGQEAAALSVDSEASHSAATLLREIRRDADQRTTWLLDITSDLEIPCIAALSVNRLGREIACGLAAGISLQEAACSAVREMCQYELGYHLVAVKRRANPAHRMSLEELRLLQRGAGVHPDAEPLLHPARRPRHHPPGPAGEEAAIDWVVCHIEAAGFRAFQADLTRTEFGIPVAKVIIPGLQSDPSEIATPRLVECSRERSGSAGIASRLSLH